MCKRTGVICTLFYIELYECADFDIDAKIDIALATPRRMTCVMRCSRIEVAMRSKLIVVDII